MSETAKEALERLKREEKITGRSGAVPLTPKQQMLDASEVQSAMPDKHVRWVTLRDPNKMAQRKAEGYTILPPTEGGKSIGDELVLMAIPRDLYEQRVARQDAENRRRLNQHNREWEALAENQARILRDKHGITVSPEQLMRG